MKSNVGSFRDYELRDLPRPFHGQVRPPLEIAQTSACSDNGRCRLTDRPAATTRNNRLLQEILVPILTPCVTQIHVSRLRARVISARARIRADSARSSLSIRLSAIAIVRTNEGKGMKVESVAYAIPRNHANNYQMLK